MAATITLHVVAKDTKALDYLNALDQKARVLEKPITLHVDANEVNKTTAAIHKVGDAYSKLWSRITSTVTRRVINETFTALRTNLRDTLNTMKEVDAELINIQKVSGKTSEEIAAIGERAYDTAAKFGVAVEEYLSAVYSFQKAGLGQNAEELAELATKTMLVGDTTAAVAEKFLISSNAAWQLHGNIDELNKVIDQADYINNNYATTLDKIAAGLPIVASVAANAGMSYSETMAALGTIQSITQESGTKSATALRALILNIEKEVGTFVTDEGEEFEVTAESVKGLEGLLRKYAAAEMEAAEASGKLLDPMVAIKALFEGMRNNDVTDIELFQLLSAMGGKLRTNQLTALVKNFDMFDEMLKELGGSAGTADKEVSLMLGSWEKKTQILKDRWTQFIAKLVNTDEIKGFIDDITEFVVNLDAEKIGSAIRDTIYPIIEFIKNTDWAGAAQKISEIFDKIMSIGKGTAIAAGIGMVIGGLDKILGLLQSIGAFLGVGSGAAVASGAGILGGLALLAGTVSNIAGPAIETQKQIESLTKASKELEEVTNDTNKAYQNQIESLDATRTVLWIYLDRLDGLTEGTDEYNNTLEAMVQLMPGLADIIDTTTGHIEGGKDAILDYADSWYKAAEAAVYQAQYTEIASKKIEAELERSSNQKRLDSIMEEHPEIAAYKELLAAREAFEEKMFSGFALSAQESKAYNDLIAQIDAMESTTSVKEAIMEANQLRAAIDLQTDRIDAAQGELDELTSLYGANNSAQEAAAAASVITNEQDAAAAAAARATEQRRGQKAAAQEATQAEQEFAQAATASGEAGQQAATITAGAVREDVVPALHEVRDALAEIPEERGITLTPYFGAALDAIREYCHFLDYLHENYSSTLTTTITHDDREHGKYTSTTTHGTAGANGIPARAAGDSNFPGGPTLVNELGPELISENGRAYIAGGGRPTVVNLSPGAIVIPADQTAEALKGGMPKYGRASVPVGVTSGWGGEMLLDIPSGQLVGGTKIRVGSGLYNAIHNIRSGGSGGGSGKGGSGSSGGANKITFDFKSLETALTNTLGNLNDRIKLAENEGDFVKMAELYEQAQEAIKDLADKYRQAGYSDDSPEIVKLLNKNYEYAKKQLDIYDDKWDELIAALEADTDATKAAAELEEKRLALEEAVAAYENAQKQRTVRMYNAATGQWEWIADNKQIQGAREKVTSAEENYNSAVKKQAIEELKKMKENVSDLSDVVLGPALSAVVTMSESTEEFQNFARALNAVFGVGSFLQSTEGTTKALSTVDSHDTHYSFGGVDITPEQAGSMTLKQLAEMLQVLKLT